MLLGVTRVKSQDKKAEVEFFTRFMGSGNPEFLGWGEKQFRRALRPLDKTKRLTLNQRLLDLGCGDGEFTSRLVLSPVNVVGLDVTYAVIRVNKSINPSAGFVCGDAENLPFKDGQFDILVATFLLHHFRRHDRIMSEIRRVLKDEGVFLVVEPNSWNPVTWYRHNTERGRMRSKKPHTANERIFSARYLRRLLKPDFKIQEFKTINFDLVRLPEAVEAFFEKTPPFSLFGATAVVCGEKRPSSFPTSIAGVRK